jgi:hypothetical protein
MGEGRREEEEEEREREETKEMETNGQKEIRVRGAVRSGTEKGNYLWQ